MKVGQSDVKSKGKVVGVANYDIYDSVAEAIATLGEEMILEQLVFLLFREQVALVE